MRRASTWIGWALCLCASLAVSAQNYPEDAAMTLDLIRGDGAQPESEFLRCNKAAWRVPGQYLVILHQGTHESHVQRTIGRLRAKADRRGYQLRILQTYSGALHGFLVKMSTDVLQLAVKLPHVHYIEEDSSIFAQSAPWNLQRLLQPHGGVSENGTYRPPNDGGMAEVYLMDGSVQSSHREVGGRVLITDFNNVPEEDGVRVHRQSSQCDSHGTHVAGVVSGSDSGVARGAGVNLVRVLNCQGKGTVSGALAGLEYIRATLLARPVQAVVVLLPFIGGFSRSLNAACRDMVANGAVVIAAAGNYREDACLYSPASEPEVITVGAVNAADQLMSQGAGGTNVGRCVDLFAPGDDIVGPSSDCSTCFTTRSGTSQAAAHAAGVAAVILSSNPDTSPVQVLQMMLHHSVSNAVNLLSLSDTHRLTTPNLVAAMPPANGTAWCTSWSTAEVSSNSRPHLGDRKRCAGKDGVTSHAVCCHAPSLECHLLENTLADKDQVEVSCPSGWTLTDCSVVPQGSAVLRLVAKGNSCRVRGATGADGAVGVAVCCRVRPPEQPATDPQ
ncbi:proprotein convertase subtilisin/kexin type 9 isoform X3 [Xiphias gladius]|uniref:proprotein convertase subtilisin/kexin type 9 isoform X3 n=1 Tax=Xiphias gladius TaxID=8245 RepID=UPI001A98D73F|nr:proprotein convertase subtilisin/kexin type 9 isoform X3 [Xiphias gladius]